MTAASEQFVEPVPRGDADPPAPTPDDAGVVVVVPAYNDAATIATLIDEVLERVPRVIVVDDGSTDGTAELLAGFPVTVLKHETNQGKGNSLITGMRAALAQGASAVVTLDADGQHRAADIPRFLAAAARAPGCMIVGNRLADRAAMPAARYHGNTIANFWISWASGYPVEDSQCGYRLYPRPVLEAVSDRHRRDLGFVFESEIIIDAARLGHRSVPVGIPALYPGSDARASHFRPWRDVTGIVLMVAGKLLARGMHPAGLVRYLAERWRRTG